MPQVTLAVNTQADRTAAPVKNGSASFVVPLLMVLSVCAALYLTFGIFWTKFSRAEVFFAECAREMIAYNNMVTPLYHAKPFFDKPIFVYWLIVSMYKAMGVSHLAARIPSMLAALITVAMTAWATRAVAPARKDTAGLIAAMCLGSGFLFFSFSYLCMSDMFLVMFDTATLILMYLGAMREKARTRYWLLAAASMGFAFITKGPIGIVLPGAAMVSYLAFTKRLHFIKFHHVAAGALIAALIAIPWFYAAYKANGTWALAYFFLRENVQRYAGSTYDTHKPIWFMVVSFFTGFLPWSVFIPPAFMAFVQQYKNRAEAAVAVPTPPCDRPGFAIADSGSAPRGWTLSMVPTSGAETADVDSKLYLWLWIAVVTAFFSLSRGKCDYYILPTYPAAAMLVGLYLSEQVRTVPRVLAMVLCGLCLVAGLASPLILTAFATSTSFEHWWLMPAALVGFGALGLAAGAKKRIFGCVSSIFMAVCCAGAGFAGQLMPAIGQSQSLDIYTQAMRATPAQTRIGVHNGLGHWIDELTFTVERDPVELSDSKSIEAFFAQGKGMALIPEPNFKQALSESLVLRGLPLTVLDRRAVSSHPLTPGYVLRRKGKLYDTTLLLVGN